MVRSPTELAELSYDAWNRGDLEWILEHTATGFELRTPQLLQGVKAVYRGREGMLEYWQLFRSFWDELAVEPRHLIPIDECTALALLEFRGVWHGSETEVLYRYAHLWTFENELCVRLQGFTGWEEGLELAGLDRGLAAT